MDYTGITKLKDNDLEFVRDYTFRLQRFRLLVEDYKKSDLTEMRKKQCAAALRNTDLWIDSLIKKYPCLHEFRMHVFTRLRQLKLEPWPREIYEHENIYNK